MARYHSVLAKISTWFSRNSSISAELWDFYKAVPKKVWAAVVITPNIWSFCKALLGGVSPCGVNRGKALARKRGGQFTSGVFKVKDDCCIQYCHCLPITQPEENQPQMHSALSEISKNLRSSCTLSWNKKSLPKIKPLFFFILFFNC